MTTPAVFEILGPKQLGYAFDLSGSRDVVGHVTIRFIIGHFLFASSDSFFGMTHRLTTIHRSQTTERRTQHSSMSPAVSTVG